MISALPLAIAQIGDRRFVAVLLKAFVLTIMLLVVAWFGLDWLLERIDARHFPELLARGWTSVADHAALAIVILVGWFLFPGIATGVMSLFLDDVVDAVEDRHYPGSAAIRNASVGDSIMMGLASALRLIVWNVALLPLYVLLLFTALGPMLLFVALNGWLMGRDLLEMVAIRHLPRTEAASFAKANLGTRLRLGATAAPLFLIPFANLLAPIIAAALAVHAFQRARKL